VTPTEAAGSYRRSENRTSVSGNAADRRWAAVYETAYRSILEFLNNISGEFDLSDLRHQENVAERLALHLEKRGVLARFQYRAPSSAGRGQ